METLAEQFVIPLLRRVRKYQRGTRADIVEDVYHNKIQEVLTYRCRHCGRFKAPSPTTCCEECAVQCELFI